MDVYHFHLLPWTGIEDDAHAVWPFERANYDRERCAELYEEYLSMLELSEQLGLDGVAFNEHHFSAYAMDPAPNLFAAQMAARTSEIDIAFMGNVIPIRGNPVRLAEELAVLDTMSRGRIVSGFARGIPIEYLAYGIDREESRARFAEAWELIVAAWTAEEPFDWDGEFWQYEDVYIWPKPYQQPHPPLLMPAGSEESLEFAAEKQVPIGQSAGPEEAREIFDTYRRVAVDEHGWTPRDEHFVMAKGIYVGESTEQAREEIREHLDYRWRTLFAGVHRGAAARRAGDEHDDPAKHKDLLPPTGQEATEFDLEVFIDAGKIIAGDPEHVSSELIAQYEAVGGFGRLFGGFQFGTLPPEKTEASLRLFANEVLPELRDL